MDYDKHLHVIRSFLKTLNNFQTIGRNGMHAYNNMDLAMYSGNPCGQKCPGRDSTISGE